MLTPFADALMFSASPLCQQHNSHVEPSNSRFLNDRKRKYVDTELAQDTEGNIIIEKAMNAL